MSSPDACRAINRRIISTGERQYGTIGVVFAIESWLVVIAGLSVARSIRGALAAQAESAFGRWARGSADPYGWHRVPGRLIRRRRTDDRSS